MILQPRRKRLSHAEITDCRTRPFYDLTFLFLKAQPILSPRFCRLRQYNILYICGTDEYGTASETKVSVKVVAVFVWRYRKWNHSSFTPFLLLLTSSHHRILLLPLYFLPLYVFSSISFPFILLLLHLFARLFLVPLILLLVILFTYDPLFCCSLANTCMKALAVNIELLLV